jgi:hypothetical protein
MRWNKMGFVNKCDGCGKEILTLAAHSLELIEQPLLPTIQFEKQYAFHNYKCLKIWLEKTKH